MELRSFEMPPHARMSLVQCLLLRTLIARFWKEPYAHELVRWGTELHDRFLLPHFVREDMKQVVADLNRAGYPFEHAWLEPFYEFRFPTFGTVNRITSYNVCYTKLLRPRSRSEKRKDFHSGLD